MTKVEDDGIAIWRDSPVAASPTYLKQHFYVEEFVMLGHWLPRI